MNKNILIAIVVGILLIGGIGIYLLSSQKTSSGTEVLGEPAVTIVRTATGYEPNEVTIKKGDIILWTNESGEFHWPASDLHPTHGIYSEFDPLVPVGPGEDWKFKFDKVGVWKFHDHIRANEVGVVTVTE